MDRGLFEMAPLPTAQQFDSGPFETGEFASSSVADAGEQYVDTATWQADPLRGHGGAGAKKMANVVRMYRSPNYKWLVFNASRFGWFPYRREPWHWEYNPPGFAARFGLAAPAREYEADDMWAGEAKPTAPACENRMADRPAIAQRGHQRLVENACRGKDRPGPAAHHLSETPD
jgi:hypothetical protein